MSTVRIIEKTLEEILVSSDWAEVFADESSGNTTKETDACPPGTEIDLTPPNRADIAEIIALVNGENDGDEWIGVFRLKDGRFLVAAGSCDCTGWDCQAGNSLQVGHSLDSVLIFGLTEDQCLRLGLVRPAA